MEFKGTKTKWNKIRTMGNKQDKDCFYKIIKDENNRTIAEAKGIHYGISNEECIYNALLISKAPEMLEMLNKLIITFSDNEDNELWQNSRIEEAKQLIEQATKID